jgi:hypothetical protein
VGDVVVTPERRRLLQKAGLSNPALDKFLTAVGDWGGRRHANAPADAVGN